MKSFMVSLFILTSLLSGAAFAAGHSFCDGDLTLLDSQLMTVLDDITRLHLEARSADAHSPYAIKLFSTLNDKMFDLENLIIDQKLREVAKKYIVDRINAASETAKQGDIEDARLEAEQRYEEEKLISPYDLINKKDIKFGRPGAYVLTPEGVVVGASSAAYLQFRDLTSETSREIAFPAAIQGDLFYHLGSNEMFLANENKIRAFKISEALAGPLAPRRVSEKDVVLSINKESQDKMMAAIEAVFPGAWVQFTKNSIIPIGGFQNKIKVSEDGNVLASYFGMTIKQVAQEGIITFNRSTKEFKVMNVPVFAGSDTSGWSLSPNGRFILARTKLKDVKTLKLYDMNTNAVIQEFPYQGRIVEFSRTGKWILTQDAEPTIYTIFEADGKGQPKIFDVSQDVDLKKYETLPAQVSFSADDSKFIITNAKGQFWVWDIATEKLLEFRTLKGVKPEFSKDGETILTRNLDHSLGLDQVLIWKRKP